MKPSPRRVLARRCGLDEAGVLRILEGAPIPEEVLDVVRDGLSNGLGGSIADFTYDLRLPDETRAEFARVLRLTALGRYLERMARRP